MMSASTLALLQLVLVAVIWGSGFIATEYAIRSGMPTEAIMTLRFGIAAIVLGLIRVKELKKKNKATMKRGMVAGAFLFGAFYAQTIGQGMTKVSHTAFLTATNVVMIPFILWLLDKKRPPLKLFMLSALVLVGIGLITLNPGEGFALNLGDAVVLLCAFLFAMHIVYVGRSCKEDDPGLLTFWQVFFSAVISIVLMLVKGSLPTGNQLQAGILPVLYLGLFSTCLCYFLQTHAQQKVPPAQAGIALSMEGVFGTAFSIALGLEVIRIGSILGGFIITGAVIALGMSEKKADSSPMNTEH